MMYQDGTTVELGDRCEVRAEGFESEEAVVAAIGKKKIQVEYVNEYIKPRREYVFPHACDLLARG